MNRSSVVAERVVAKKKAKKKHTLPLAPHAFEVPAFEVAPLPPLFPHPPLPSAHATHTTPPHPLSPIRFCQPYSGTHFRIYTCMNGPCVQSHAQTPKPPPPPTTTRRNDRKRTERRKKKVTSLFMTIPFSAGGHRTVGHQTRYSCPLTLLLSSPSPFHICLCGRHTHARG